MSYNVAEYVIGYWCDFCDQDVYEKMADLSLTVFLWSTNEAHEHTPTIAIGENATRCISPKNLQSGQICLESCFPSYRL